jgi:hypothetical protein
LTIRSSQVGMVSPARRTNRSYGDRLALALRILSDHVFKVLFSEECRFHELPDVLPRLAANEPGTLCLRVTYQVEDTR